MLLEPVQVPPGKKTHVPDIPNKLIKSPQRKSLNEQRKFWDIVQGELGSFRFTSSKRSAIEIIQHKAPKNKFLQDYLTIFPSLSAEHLNQQKFLEQFQPLVTIAGNNGFLYL